MHRQVHCTCWSVSNGLDILVERSNTLLVDTVVIDDTGALWAWQKMVVPVAGGALRKVDVCTVQGLINIQAEWPPVRHCDMASDLLLSTGNWGERGMNPTIVSATVVAGISTWQEELRDSRVVSWGPLDIVWSAAMDSLGVLKVDRATLEVAPVWLWLEQIWSTDYVTTVCHCCMACWRPVARKDVNICSVFSSNPGKAGSVGWLLTEGVSCKRLIGLSVVGSWG